MVNSLRLLGHAEPIFVLDAGLTEWQRVLLATQATIVDPPENATPFALKTIAPLAHPAEVMTLIDADVVVVQPLGELIEKVRGGLVAGVRHGQERFFDEWSEVAGRPATERPYVSSSLVFLGGEPGAVLIREMDRIQPGIDLSRTPYETGAPELEAVGATESAIGRSHPFYLADQDVLNAVIATTVAPDGLLVLDRRAEAIMPFSGLTVIDVQRLRCAYEDGSSPLTIHHYLPIKPWLRTTSRGPYTQLLIRLLGGDDVAIKVPRGRVPLPVRSGGLGHLHRAVRGALGG